MYSTTNSSARARQARLAMLLSGTALGVSLLVVPASARADDCGPNTGQPIVCPAQPYPNGIWYQGDTPLDLTVSGVATSTDERSGVVVIGGTGDVKVDASNIAVTGVGSDGLWVETTSGDVDVKARAVSTTGGNFAEALYVRTDSGDVHIDADGMSTAGTYSSPIAVETRAGDVTIVSGGMTTTAVESSALYAAASENGAISIQSRSVDATGQAIVASSGGAISILSEDVLVRDGAGAGSTGLYGYSRGADVVIDSGTVSTSAVRGRAVGAFADAGSVTITSDAVETFGAGSPGVRGSAVGDVTIVSGSVITHGGRDVFNGVTRNSEGIWASSPTGVISIDSGSVETHGDFAMGILVDRDGSVPWTGPRGADASNGTGALTIKSGSVTTTGTEAYGILVDHRGAISIDSGSIHTTGLWGHGLYVYGEQGIDITSGSVIVEGTAAGLVARTVDGDITIDSDYAQSFNDVAIGAFSTNGDIRIVSDEALTTQVGAVTHPDNFTGDAVIAQTATGSIFIDSGRAETRSDYAWGVTGTSTSGDVTLISDEVLTNGINGYGVYAQTGGDVSIDSGAVTTLGATSVGVTGISTAGDTVIANDSVTTSGLRSFGVVGQATAGTVSIDSGEVVTSGDGAYGIRAVGQNGVSILSDSITTSGGASSVNGQNRYAWGIWASSPTGAISIDSGEIATSGAFATGILVDADGSALWSGPRGADPSNGTGVLTLKSGSITTTGGEAYGILVDHRGAISIDSQSIHTTGMWSHGLYVYGEQGIDITSGSVIVEGTASGLVARTVDGDIAIASGYAQSKNDVAVAAFTTSGDVRIVSGEALTTQVGAVTHPDGFTADAVIGRSTSGSVFIDSGRAETRSDYAWAVTGLSSTGAVTIESDEVLTNGINGHGVYAQTAGAVSIDSGAAETKGFGSVGITGISSGGSVVIASDSVVTAGARSSGVIGQATAGTVSIDSGSVATLGDGALGIRALGRDGVSVIADSVTTVGGVSVQNGQVQVAHGIWADSALGPITIDAGQISVSGQGASGINAVAAKGTVTIDFDAIETSGAYYGFQTTNAQNQPITVNYFTNGVYAQSQNVGDVVVSGGDITVTNTQSWALYARAFGGASRIDVGALETFGEGSRGIYAVGLTDVSVTADSIHTRGGYGLSSASEGVWAWSQTGAVNLDIGSVVTEGANSHALFVQGSQRIDVLADAISTAGDNAKGLLVLGSGGAVTADIGSVQTTGAYSDGVRVESGAGAATVNVGSVSATGDASAGVRVISTSGAIDINVGVASTSGDTLFDANDVGTYAEAVTAYSDSGDITIAVGQSKAEGLYASNVSAESQTGDISITSGSALSTAVGAAAVAAATYNGGDIVLNSGSVTSLAAGVQGQSTGDLTITSGSVNVTGAERATAVFGLTSRGGDLSIASETITTASNGGRGVYADAGGDIVVSSGSIVSTATDTAYNANGQMLRGDGITVFNRGQGSTSVASGSITTQALGARGIAVSGAGGVVTVSGGDVTTSGADATGIQASNTGSGALSVSAGALATAGEGSTGVSVFTNDGSVSASVQSVKTTGAGGDAIYASSVNGAVLVQAGSVEATGGLSGQAAADGIVATSQSGSVSVGAQSVKATGEGAMGVLALTQGDVSVALGQVVGGQGPAAVWGESTGGGDVVVTATSVTAGRAGVVAMSAGDVTVNSGAMSITGVSGYSHAALTARSFDGNTRVTSTSVTNQGGGVGIYADAGGLLNIVSGSVVTGGVTVPGSMPAYGIQAASAGTLTLSSQSVTTGGAYAHGIVARGNGGEATVTSGAVTTTGEGARGIDAVAAETLSLTSGSVSTTGADAIGIYAESVNGDVVVSSQTITTKGARAYGLAVKAGDDAVITTGTITATGQDAVGLYVEADDATVNVTGKVVAANGYGAMMNLTGAGVVNLAKGTSLEGGIAGLYLNSTQSSTINILGEIVGLGGTALVVTGAPVTVNNNSNTIIGGIQLTAGADTFNNNGTWVAYGQSDFGAGADVIVNNGLFKATGAGGVTINGLETFQNNAAMDLRNGSVGDTVNLGGAAYVGGAGSTLLVDVDFATGKSDSLAVASATGSTQISVNDISTGDGFNPGLKFIESSTPLTGGEFTLDPASVENGFADLDLEFDAATNSFVIKALPSSDSVSMLRAGAAAQDYASKSGEAWSGRLEDLRDSGFSGVGRGRNEVWGQILFGERELEQSGTFDLLGTMAFRDLSSETSWSGVQMGVDHAFGMGAGQLAVGFTGGLMDYQMSFSADANRFDVTGFNVGGYGAYTAGGLMLSALVKYDQFDITARLNDIGAKSDFDGSSVDLQAEAAYRFGGPGFFVEPVVAADWVKSDIDDLVVAGARAQFSDVESLRGRLGARIGAVAVDGVYTVTPFLGLYAIEEFKGENAMDFTFGASSYRVNDIPYDTHGRLDFGASVMGPMGLNAFIKTEADFGDGAKGLTFRVGARWSW